MNGLNLHPSRYSTSAINYSPLFPEVTPDAPDWETYRAWHLIGHIRANLENKPLGSFKEEVLAAREVRDSLADRGSQQDLLSPSIEAAKILHDHDLDGRSIEGMNTEDKEELG